MDSLLLEDPIRALVRKEAGRLMGVGAVFLAIGLTAIVFPLISTFIATLFVGWILIVSGLATLVGAFSIRGAGPFFGALLLALLSLGGGVFILARPLAGELGVTLSVGAIFVVQGALEIGMAMELRPDRSWIWMLLSGVASVVLALAILAGWPGSSLVAIGIVIGVNFVTSGLAYLVLGQAARRNLAAPKADPARL